MNHGTGIVARLRAGLWLAGGCLALLALPAHSQTAGGFFVQYIFNFNGNQVTIDSFDSSDPAHSAWQTQWFYNGSNYGTYTNTLRTANAVVGTDGSLLYADWATIYGFVNTAPGGAVSLNSGGVVGDLNWIGPDPRYPLNYGIQPGHQDESMSMAFPNVALPTPAAWFPVPAPTSANIVVGGQTYAYTKVFGNWGYQIGGVLYSLVITNRTSQPGTPANKIYYQYPSSLSQNIFIDASNVVLYLPNGIRFGSGDYLTINTNASVEIYSAGDLDTGNGWINNLAQYAPALTFYGLPLCANITFGGNAVLTTCLYAPSASVSFNGGGGTAYDVVGAMTASDITVNGHFNFHFDETLGTKIPVTVITGLTNQAVQAGSNAVFTMKTNGAYPLVYQWYFNQTNLLAGATNASLSLTNVQLSDAGYYSVFVLNPHFNAGISTAMLFVYTNIAQLVPRLVPAGITNHQFRFDLTGVAGLGYAVQVSTNLTDWSSLLTNAAPFSFTDSNASLFPQRFYRSVFAP